VAKIRIHITTVIFSLSNREDGYVPLEIENFTSPCSAPQKNYDGYQFQRNLQNSKQATNPGKNINLMYPD